MRITHNPPRLRNKINWPAPSGIIWFRRASMSETGLPEPWLRGSLPEVRSVPRAVLHALELASEDLRRWCGNLTEEELNRRPDGIPSVAFHLKHIARGVDRLLTYAEGEI